MAKAAVTVITSTPPLDLVPAMKLRLNKLKKKILILILSTCIRVDGWLFMRQLKEIG